MLDSLNRLVIVVVSDLRGCVSTGDPQNQSKFAFGRRVSQNSDSLRDALAKSGSRTRSPKPNSLKP